MNSTLLQSYKTKLRELRALVDAAGGAALGDKEFSQYCRIEDEIDSLAHRIGSEQGEIFGPQLPTDAARSERLSAREKWFWAYVTRHQYDIPPGGGLEGGTSPSERGAGGGFASLGEQLRAIASACTIGGQRDQRLEQRVGTLGMEELTGGAGGFALGRDFALDLLNRTANIAQIAPRCRTFPIAANRSSIDLPMCDEVSRASGSRWGGVSCTWMAEGGTASPTKPKLRIVTLKPGKLVGLVYTTNELLEDSTALTTFIEQAFAEEMAFTIDDAIYRGDGAGKPLGVLNAGCLVSVAKESGQIADTFVYENAVKMFARLPASSLRTACWFINQEVNAQLPLMVMKIWNSPATEVVGGSSVYVPPKGASDAPYGRLLGLPVVVCEQASALGDKGDVLLGDFSRYLLGVRGSMRVDQSIHVEFLTDQSCFRFVYRIDGCAQDKSATTPYLGSSQTSAFITLDAR